MAQTAAQKKRSAAAKKAAETRKKKQEESEAQANNGNEQSELSEEQDASSEESEGVEPYQPNHRPLKNAGLDQHAAERERQAALAEERRVGLLRTAGQPVD